MVIITRSTKTAAELNTERVVKRRAARARLEALGKEPRNRMSLQHDTRAKRPSRAQSNRVVSGSFFAHPAPRSAEEEEEEDED